MLLSYTGKRVSRVFQGMDHVISISPLVYLSRRRPAPRFFLAIAWLCVFMAPLAVAASDPEATAGTDSGGDTLEVMIDGVPEVMADNIKAFISTRWVSPAAFADERPRRRFEESAVEDTRLALRPYGYYFPVVETALAAGDDGGWLLRIRVDAGEPVLVGDVNVEVTGPGAGSRAISRWQARWPLRSGDRLDQTIWDAQKTDILTRAESLGYLSARFTVQDIALDLVRRRADLSLVLDTGPRAVMGDVVFHQDVVDPAILSTIPRFDRGDPYRIMLLDRLRTDLWKTGYFGEIDVAEVRRLDQQPPVVDVRVTLEDRKPNTHQTSLGWGTDTEFRMQYRWLRNLLSDRGDSLALGTGWQTRYEEWTVFGEYRLPRRVESQQYWLANGLYKTEVQDLELVANGSDTRYTLGSARVDTASVRAGRARLIDLGLSTEPIVETLYAEYLYERNAFDHLLQNPLPDVPFGPGQPEVADAGFGDAIGTLSLGVEYDWPVIRGSGFRTRGHHERAWLFTSQDAWGSDRSFTQLYLSSRWNFMLADRLKLLVRGEMGYTEADVTDFEFGPEGETFQISVTELPFNYRFKAGGSRSVRGYGYEELSDNGIGSNNILTASAELEYLFLDSWSAAAFVDVGNAFNEWSDVDLKRGVGLGVRWYTIAGAVRVDVARGLDSVNGDWQVHLTIGTPLL